VQCWCHGRSRRDNRSCRGHHMTKAIPLHHGELDLPAPIRDLDAAKTEVSKAFSVVRAGR
jgi:hypothetical protein